VGRKVFTWNGTSGVNFPTATQTATLARTGGLAPVTGADNANYIKGTTTLERRFGGELRNRASLLGDIVNSSPAYSADTSTLYVGANDGMLHAFDATTGAERFAYVPGGIDFTNLATLSDPQYVHRYFVDGPVVASSFAQTPGKNYLVGALGRGGKGLYGLDVTTPASFAAGNALWEVNDAGGDMGMVVGEPLVVTLNDTANTKAVVVSNGFNSTNGHSVLFLINIATGAIIKKFDTGVGGDNGMSAPLGLDTDRSGTLDYVYAGDRKGNLWKFDVTGNTARPGTSPSPASRSTPRARARRSPAALRSDATRRRPRLHLLRHRQLRDPGRRQRCDRAIDVRHHRHRRARARNRPAAAQHRGRGPGREQQPGARVRRRGDPGSGQAGLVHGPQHAGDRRARGHAAFGARRLAAVQQHHPARRAARAKPAARATSMRWMPSTGRASASRTSTSTATACSTTTTTRRLLVDAGADPRFVRSGRGHADRRDRGVGHQRVEHRVRRRQWRDRGAPGHEEHGWVLPPRDVARNPAGLIPCKHANTIRTVTTKPASRCSS
jgi:hypothetical protein